MSMTTPIAAATSAPVSGMHHSPHAEALGHYDLLVGNTVIRRDGVTAIREALWMERAHKRQVTRDLRKKLATATRRGFQSTLVKLDDLDYLLTSLENADA